jgi:hypothetical protein
VSVNVWSPTTIDAGRALDVVLAATENVMVPLPVPFADVMVAHGALLVAVQAQIEGVATASVPVPPTGVSATLVPSPAIR